MKRFFAAVLTLMFLLSAAGCSTEQPLQTDWQNVMTYSTFGALSEQGYYYPQNSVLHYADLATGQSVVLCSLAGCLHEDEQCDACIGLGRSNTMFFSNGYLYFFNDQKLYRRSAIGTEEKLIGTPGESVLERGGAFTSMRMTVAGSLMYYCAMVSFGGNSSEGSSDVFDIKIIGRMDLTTGKDTVLVEQPVKKGTLLSSLDLGAVREDGMLFTQCDGVQGNKEDADFAEKSESAPVKLLHWDAATGEVTTLLEKPRKELLRITYVYQGMVYYYGTGKPDGQYLYDLSTGEVKEKPDMDLISSWLGGPYVTLLGRKPFNLETGEPISWEGLGANPVAASALGFVTLQHTKNEENPNESSAIEYYYIPFSAMTDGVQQEDRILLWTEKMGGG